MNKRGTKILIGCIICTSIVLLLFLIVFKFTQLSCELVSLDPIRLGSHQLREFSRDSSKPVRSHDETILMRISAYLEYNIQPESSGGGGESASGGGKSTSGARGSNSNESWNWSATRANLTQAGHQASPSNDSTRNSTRVALAGGQQQQVWAQPQMVAGQATSQQQQHQLQQQPQGSTAPDALQHNAGPSPSRPDVAAMGQISTFPSGNLQMAQQQQQQQPPPARIEKRFLPLELKSIETRNMLEGARHKYILKFNCTKINMVLVHQNNRVFIESMSLELKPSSKQETSCEIQLPPSGAFTVADSSGFALQSAPIVPQHQQLDQPINGSTGHPSNGNQQNGPNSITSGATNTQATANNNKQQQQQQQQQTNTNNNNSHSAKNYPQLARYYCNKPLRYSCYHYSSKNGIGQSNGVLLAELHINGIEFETSTSWQAKHKKVKSEFKGKRSDCNMA